MRTGTMGRVRAVGAMLAVAGALWVTVPLEVSAAPLAQQTTDCRCVDAGGNAIADCTCIRLPRIESMALPFAPRPRLGLSVDTDQGSTIDAQGARVTRVMEGGPAAQAGIREGDLITSIDGHSLFEPLPGDREDDFELDASLPVQRLLALARELEPGQDVRIEYLRGGVRQTATVQARELQAQTFEYHFDEEKLEDMLGQLRNFEFRFDGPGSPGEPGVRLFPGGGDAPFFFRGSSGRYGVELVELNPGLGQYFGTDRGVLVTDVEEGSTLGLRAGDVILRVGDREVTSPERALRILATYGDEEQIPLRVRRDGREVDVMGRLR